MSGRTQNGIVNYLVTRRRVRWTTRATRARRCRRTDGAITHALRGLVNRGDLEKKTDPRDRRRKLYRLRRS